jgi:Reverse transcriptase (RNA-dependent DNA polymerase)
LAAGSLPFRKIGGIRPIAIGYTWRRLAAKCANRYAITIMGSSLVPSQLGVGASSGCEAAVHATQRFLSTMPDDQILVKLNFSKAFNSISRDAVLAVIANILPDLYKFCPLAYHQNSVLQFGQHTIHSQEGVQQGDPLGPLLFCVAIHPLLSSLTSNLTIGYLDDFTLGGSVSSVANDVSTFEQIGASF